MKLFNDISKFNNVSDYLPILNGILFVETFTIFFTLHSFLRSKVLTFWYKKFQLSAVLADVSIVFLGIILTRFIYPLFFSQFSLILFILLALFIQMTHDILFYKFFTWVPRGVNAMLDVFKDYATEVRHTAILGDSIIMICSCLLASHFSTYSLNANIINLIITLYFIPYLLFIKY
jgi:hypothetical protein